MKPTRKASPPSSAQLFDESHAAPPAGVHVANIDGASRGNPGPAAYAVVMRAPEGSKIAEIAKRIGRETNNVAEYYALVAALDYAAAHSIRALRVRSDSELLVRQIQGRYKVKNADLKPLYERAQKLARGLQYFAIEHVPREQNCDADSLANLALDDVSIGNKPGIAPQEHAPKSAARVKAPRIRAHYRGGVFVPASAVNLAENTVVELDIHVSKAP